MEAQTWLEKNYKCKENIVFIGFPYIKDREFKYKEIIGGNLIVKDYSALTEISLISSCFSGKKADLNRLTIVNCEKLKRLTISSSKIIDKLDLSSSGANLLQELKITDNTSLLKIIFPKEGFPNLKVIRLENNKSISLDLLSLIHNSSSITSLVLKNNNSKLFNLREEVELKSLRDFRDVSNLENLNSLEIEESYFEYINLEKIPQSLKTISVPASILQSLYNSNVSLKKSIDKKILVKNSELKLTAEKKENERLNLLNVDLNKKVNLLKSNLDEEKNLNIQNLNKLICSERDYFSLKEKNIEILKSNKKIKSDEYVQKRKLQKSIELNLFLLEKKLISKRTFLDNFIKSSKMKKEIKIEKISIFSSSIDETKKQIQLINSNLKKLVSSMPLLNEEEILSLEQLVINWD